MEESAPAEEPYWRGRLEQTIGGKLKPLKPFSRDVPILFESDMEESDFRKKFFAGS